MSGLTLDVQVTLKEALSKLPQREVEQMLTDALLPGAQVFMEVAKRLAPFDQGPLRHSIHIGGHTGLSDEWNPSEGLGYRDLGNPGPMQQIVGTTMIYAKVHEYGATIKAKNAPYLVFQTDDGAWHSVKEVRIPPRPYMRPAFEGEKAQAIRKIAETVQAELATRLGK